MNVSTQMEPREQRQPSGVFKLFDRYPVTSAVTLAIIDLAFAVLVGSAAKAWTPGIDPAFLALCVLTVAVAGVLTALGWWRVVGFNRPRAWRNLRLMWVPGVVAIVLPFLHGARSVPALTILYLAVGYGLTGFTEEAWSRGILLRILERRGIVPAILVSSILFALSHATNLLFRNPFVVGAQMVGAFCDGLAMAALRVRTRTIWTVILFHAVHDLFLQLSGFPVIPLDVVQDIILLVYGLYLIHGIRTGTADHAPGASRDEAQLAGPQAAS